MKVIEADKIVFFDCDDTLVMWGHENHPDAVTFKDIYDPNPDAVYALVPHQRHVKMVSTYKQHNYTVVVWSQGGWQWAKEVVRVLGLEDKVDLVMSKPDVYIDDIEASKFMQRKYFKSRIVYPEDK